MNDNVLTKDCGVLADAMQSVRRSLKMADRLADGYIPPMGGERYLTDRDLARRLHVSRRTLQQYRHEGILPYFLLLPLPMFISGRACAVQQYAPCG